MLGLLAGGLAKGLGGGLLKGLGGGLLNGGGGGLLGKLGGAAKGAAGEGGGILQNALASIGGGNKSEEKDNEKSSDNSESPKFALPEMVGKMKEMGVKPELIKDFEEKYAKNLRSPEMNKLNANM